MKHLSSRTLCRGFGAAALFTALTLSSRAHADYPIASHRYLADPGALVHDGRVYLYNSNDDDNAEAGGYTMHSIVCVSSGDLKNWTDHGVVFQVPADATWAGDSWAPYPLERDGKIYLYFGNNANGVGVATSTTPTGEFKDGKGSALVSSSTPGATGTSSWLFDPGALIDDDGQAYLSFGGNGESNARIIKLGSDLVSVSGSAAGLSPKGFFEASFMFKRNSIYYFAYSTNSDNGLRIDYLTSSSPMSGYTYGGIIADQPPVNNNNNHASEFEFNGKWYHAYHNRYVATQAGISTTYRRNLALEALDFDTAGKIVKVTYTTDGVTQLASLNPYVRVEAETMNAQSGIETEPCQAGGMDVTSITNGDWVKVRGVDFGSAGAKSFSASVASTMTGGGIELRLTSATGTLVGTCTVPSTGGAQTFMTTTCDVTGATGVQDLYLKFTGSGFNVDSWQFTSTDGSSGGTGGAAGAAGAAGTGGGAGSGSGGGGASGGTTAAGAAGSGLGDVGGTGGTTGGAGGAGGAPGGSGMGNGGRSVGMGGAGGSLTTGGQAAGGMTGSAGSGGTSVGTGGASVGTGGTATAGTGASSSKTSAGAQDPAGCGCAVGAGSTPRGAAFALLLALFTARRSLRRSGSKRLRVLEHLA